MTTYSVLAPRWPQRPHEILPYAALAEQFGGRLWLGQTPIGDPYQAFVFASANGFRSPVGVGVSILPYRHPYQAALQAQSAAVLLGHSMVAGFGPGPTEVQRAILGRPYRSPLTATREYLTIVRQLLETGESDVDGDYFFCRAVLPLVVAPEIQLGLGVLREKMAYLAGELADVAITWLTPASYIRDTLLPALRKGASAAGRSTPRVVAIVPVALAGESRAGPELALAANNAHLALPHYRDMLRRAGIEADPAEPERCATGLIDGGAFLFGDASQARDQLAEFDAAGVDEVVLNLTGVYLREGNRAALTDLRTLLRANRHS